VEAARIKERDNAEGILIETRGVEKSGVEWLLETKVLRDTLLG